MSARPAMAAKHGPDPILENVKVEGRIGRAFAVLRMAQRYRNDSSESIELVYTFPLPPHSTLLDVVADIGGKRHCGRVLPRGKAERSYEEAIADGNTAIMVERPEPGLFVMNFGNLMPGEFATVEVEFGTLLEWRRNRLRLAIPMTLAPRYDEEHSALDPHQRPQSDLLVERPFSLRLLVSNELKDASFTSPTHTISTAATEDGLRVELTRGEAWMDRDLVLIAESQSQPAAWGRVARDGADNLAYGCFEIPSQGHVRGARAVKVVLDCSGSMAGDSISLARYGALKLLEALRPEDRFGLVAFGSEATAWKARLSPASELHIEAASSWIRERNADMGGTEMADALRCAMSIAGSDDCDLILITDGQVARTDELIREARQLRHRIFVVGVGSAPQKEALAALAEATGGSAEWATAGEFISDAIHRIFAQLIEEPVSDFAVRANGEFDWEARTPGISVFSGDTVHFFGGGAAPVNELRAKWGDAKGKHEIAVMCRVSDDWESNVIPRLAAGLRIRQLEVQPGSQAQVIELAIQHQIVTSHTNYVLVVERGDQKAAGLPVHVKIPQMLAAGHGGVGAIVADLLCERWEAPVNERTYASFFARGFDSNDDDLSFSRKSVSTLGDFIRQANAHYGSLLQEGGDSLPLTLSAVHSLGLPFEIVEKLELLALSLSEEAVATAFWVALLKLPDDMGVSQGLRRLVSRARLAGKADQAMVSKVLHVLMASVGDREVPTR